MKDEVAICMWCACVTAVAAGGRVDENKNKPDQLCEALSLIQSTSSSQWCVSNHEYWCICHCLMLVRRLRANEDNYIMNIVSYYFKFQ